MSMRVGIGYDVHRMASGRPLVLGGVRIESDWGLDGHSDADVLCHAIADAILGAAGLGDLGAHFPPGDPRWKDASSLEMLGAIRQMLETRGAMLVNVDAMLIAEAPRLANYRAQMIERIAQWLRVPPDRISLKATTNELLGFVGRREGLAAMATALVEVAGDS
jgi:2-C-methyl-D-erythritol 2,4-cyclodiphosphate synthase